VPVRIFSILDLTCYVDLGKRLWFFCTINDAPSRCANAQYHQKFGQLNLILVHLQNTKFLS